MTESLVANVKVAGKTKCHVVRVSSVTTVKLSIDQNSANSPRVIVYHSFLDSNGQQQLSSSLISAQNKYRQYRVQAVREPHLCQCYHEKGQFGLDDGQDKTKYVGYK